MKTLRDHLGLWKYERGDKYYRVEPVIINTDEYHIAWSTGTIPDLDNPDTPRLIVNAANALSRIRSKQAGGFRLVEPYAGFAPVSSLISIGDLPRPKQKKRRIEKPKKDNFSFLDWLGGKDYPED